MIESKRAREAKKKDEPIDIEVNIGDYDDDYDDGVPLPTNDDEDYEYFTTSGLCPWYEW